MNYQRISYFIKAAETLNFSEAARQVYIAPQSFGKQIAILEQELGEKLFERTPREVVLTPFGKECYERFSGPMRALDHNFEQVCDMVKGWRKRIRVGIFSALSREKVIFPIMGTILLNYADKDVSISILDLSELQEGLQNDRIDLGITVIHDTEGGWEDCAVYPLARYPAQIAVSELHDWYWKESISLADMEAKDFVRIYHAKYCASDYYDNIPCRKVIEAENYETMNLEVKSGRAFSIMSGEVDEMYDRGYRFFDIPAEPFDYTLALIYKNGVKNTLLKDVCRLVQEEYGAEA